MDEIKRITEINPATKYVLTIPESASPRDVQRINDALQEWLSNNRPFLILSDSVKLVKVLETSKEE